ncbi:hypothetical protein BGX30_004918 [Mortierella sp. GBA39]|nr:hypothetical protein BGX30_004918 [Mortierella sp. GBA39]
MKYKKPFMLTILFMTSLPITAVMVPVYQLFLSLKLYNNIFGVILFYVASSMPYGIWMLKNFMDSVPNDMEEAAWVDGASVFTGIRKFFGQYGMADYGKLAAFSVLYALPSVVLYILSQQFMSKGFGLQGGTKG